MLLRAVRRAPADYADNRLDAPAENAHCDWRRVPGLLGRDVWDGNLPAAAHGPMNEAPTTSDAPPSPRQIVEALLFVGGSPLTAERAGEICRNLGPDQLR